MRNNPVISLLLCKAEPACRLEDLFDKAATEDTPEAMAQLLFAILQAQVQLTFYKINVHAAMTPAEVKREFKPVLNRARGLMKAFSKRTISKNSRMGTRSEHSRGKFVVIQDEESGDEEEVGAVLSEELGGEEDSNELLNSFSSLSSSSSDHDLDDDQKGNRMPFITVSLCPSITV
jgi:hypothetical protein